MQKECSWYAAGGGVYVSMDVGVLWWVCRGVHWSLVHIYGIFEYLKHYLASKSVLLVWLMDNFGVTPSSVCRTYTAYSWDIHIDSIGSASFYPFNVLLVEAAMKYACRKIAFPYSHEQLLTRFRQVNAAHFHFPLYSWSNIWIYILLQCITDICLFFFSPWNLLIINFRFK